MLTSLFIARRYLFSKKSRNAINIISGISMVAFAVCTAALIIILSAMNGFEGLIFSIYNKFDPDIRITATKGKVFDPGIIDMHKLKHTEGISYIMPVLEDNAAISHDNYQAVCTVKGVDTGFFRMTGLVDRVIKGEALLQYDSIPFVVMGAGIDYQIGTNVDGPFTTVSLATPRRGDFSHNDPSAINQMMVEPSGVLSMDETINNKYVIVPLGFARELFDRDTAVSALEIRLKPGADAAQVKESISALAGSALTVKDKYEQQESLYKMFRSEKWASFAILTLVFLIAAFNVVGSLTMLVLEKKQDIKTLKSMGADTGMIRSIFFSEGMLIAVIGGIAGITAGVVLCLLQQRYGFMKMQGAIVESYPVKVLLPDIALVFFTTLVLGCITSIYPAIRSSR